MIDPHRVRPLLERLLPLTPNQIKRRERRERQAGAEISSFVITKAINYLLLMDETFFEAMADFPDPSVWRNHKAGGTVRSLAQQLAEGRFPNYEQLRNSYPDVQKLVVRQSDPWKADLLDRSKLACRGYQTSSGVQLDEGVDIFPVFWKTKHLSAEAVQVVEAYKEDGMVQLPLSVMNEDHRLIALQRRAELLLGTIENGRRANPERSGMYSALTQITLDKLGEESLGWLAKRAAVFGDSVNILADQPPAQLVAGSGWDLGETREGLLLIQDLKRLRQFGYSYQTAQEVAAKLAERIKTETGLSAETDEVDGSIQVKVFAVVDLGDLAIDKLKASIDLIACELGSDPQLGLN